MQRKCLITALLLAALFSAGCWDVEEINKRGIADSILLDTGNPAGVKMGVSLHIPGTQIPPVAGTYQQFEKRHYVLLGEGKSTVDAWTQIQSNTVRNVFFGQLRAIIMSERLARGDINDMLEFIGRFPLVPPNTVVLVTKEDPQKLLDIKNRPNYIPGNYIDFYFQSPYKRTLALPVDLWRVNSILDKKWQDPYIPVIETDQDSYRIAGTALFSGGHMVGKLNMEETQTLALVRGAQVGYLTVPLEGSKMAAFKNLSSRSNIEPKILPDGTLEFNCAVNRLCKLFG